FLASTLGHALTTQWHESKVAPQQENTLQRSPPDPVLCPWYGVSTRAECPTGAGDCVICKERRWGSCRRPVPSPMVPALACVRRLGAGLLLPAWRRLSHICRPSTAVMRGTRPS